MFAISVTKRLFARFVSKARAKPGLGHARGRLPVLPCWSTDLPGRCLWEEKIKGRPWKTANLHTHTHTKSQTSHLSRHQSKSWDDTRRVLRMNCKGGNVSMPWSQLYLYNGTYCAETQKVSYCVRCNKSHMENCVAKCKEMAHMDCYRKYPELHLALGMNPALLSRF